eukprot:m.370694 g.370694  ORF g.370694 m.370694 type:complete len:55 (-) comp55118_c0_seq1:27-191(-)
MFNETVKPLRKFASGNAQDLPFLSFLLFLMHCLDYFVFHVTSGSCAISLQFEAS